MVTFHEYSGPPLIRPPLQQALRWPYKAGGLGRGGTSFSGPTLKPDMITMQALLYSVLAGLPGFARDSCIIIMSICAFHFYIIYFHFFSADHGIPQTFDYIFTT